MSRIDISINRGNRWHSREFTLAEHLILYLEGYIASAAASMTIKQMGKDVEILGVFLDIVPPLRDMTLR
jgi:hypothetical protein